MPTLSTGLGEVIERMMAKDREERYASMPDLIGDLEAIQRGVNRPCGLEKDTTQIFYRVWPKAERLYKWNHQYPKEVPPAPAVSSLVWLFLLGGFAGYLRDCEHRVAGHPLTSSSSYPIELSPCA